ncbi:DNA mismatch repair protein Msh6-like [Oppia nitens]|uniref:DNA mismatch repair protein Msh6-like n=1 Tax=Oppia nitens TaxID=1686743 RepID=UPI0023DC15A2|nr:DNA mismatch repair protein Msh6-like [Oppia nitens]
MSGKSPKQSNTLLNYFAKSPQITNKSTTATSSGKVVVDIKPVVDNKSSTATSSSADKLETSFKLYDLVWAKLEGYPWWPSIVCLHPSANTYVRRKCKTVFIHVQFFDDPISRAWIRVRDLKEYYGKHKSDVPLLKDVKWNQAIEFADQAMKMSVEDRYTLIGDLKGSDDDEDGVEMLDDIDFEVDNNGSLSLVNTSNEKDLSPKSKTTEKTEEQKPDLKRKAETIKENTDRKKKQRITIASSGEDSVGSDDEFKINSDDDEDSSDEEEPDIKEVEVSDNELSSVEEIVSSDSEPKQKRTKTLTTKSKSKWDKFMKSKDNKKSTKKPKKKSKKISDESEEEEEEVESEEDSISSEYNSSDSETKPKKKTQKSKEKPKKSQNKSKVLSSESEIDSDNNNTTNNAPKDTFKPNKSLISSTPAKNWLTETSKRLSKGSSQQKSKSLDTTKRNGNTGSNSNNNKLNKSIVSLADESFVSVTDQNVNDGTTKEWPHLNLEFLKPEKLKDRSGNFRLVGDKLNPDYDPTTLSVPQSFLNDCTPAQRQWWEFKCQHFDTVLFFKMGKFYELFQMDAVIAVNELQIIYMKGDYAHSGFPEKAYKRYADVLIQKGYKVARIEQTETPAMMEERVKKMNKKATKFDRVVNREVCRVSSIGTRIPSVIDSDVFSDQNSYLMAITENFTEQGVDFGICFIDVSIGTFNLSQFSDDRYYSRLRTLLAHNPPVELVFDNKNISPKTKQLVENCAPNARKEVRKEFWSPKKTLQYLSDGNFFDGQLPQELNRMLDENDSLKQTPRSDYELAIHSFGAIIEVLKESLVDEEVLSMKLIQEYKPCDLNCDNKSTDDNIKLPEHMILDSITIRNLDIFSNSLGGTEGTLLEVLDFCSTYFGKRLLFKWMCSPLCDISQIQQRQQAIADLSQVSVKYDVEEAIKVLRKLPDLERLLCKIHSQGSAKRAKDHPDSRAILFEMDTYSKRKILDFLSVLDGFKQSIKVVESFQQHLPNFKSSLLTNCLSFGTTNNNNNNGFPDLSGQLRYFDNAFDHRVAKQEGKVLPLPGADCQYDDCVEKVESIVKKFDNYLSEQKKFFGCQVSYFGSGKNRYQLEVPDNYTKKIAKDNDYMLESSRKGFKRYSTSFTKNLFEQLITAEDAKEIVLQDGMRRIFESFDRSYDKWLKAINCLSQLDVLLSLTKSRSFLQQNRSVVCLPKFSHSTVPFVDLVESRNPCLIKYCYNFIPNDIKIDNQLLLLTGPNMGGKSTLMRQLGLIVIMAQIGAYVPAKECSLTPVDRIFTRLGAFDRIIEGESTFFVELSETAIVLKHSTKHSLVLIDELGRGTSTFDGTAIAYSVAKALSEQIKCRTLFSSHYHSLVDEFKDNPHIKLVHMACMIENENESDPTEEDITFLYKLKDNACPKSYGFNAAQLAGLPKQLIRNAFKRAKQFELKTQMESIFGKVMQNTVTDNELMSIIPHLKNFSFNNN